MQKSDSRKHCSLDRLIYIDDSGAQESGYVVYGYVEVSPANWGEALRCWLDLRKSLVRDFSIPVTQELHATKFVNGRAQISTAPPARFVAGSQVDWKALGGEVMVRCLEAIRDCSAIGVGASYYLSSNRRAAYAVDKFATYSAVVHNLDIELRAQESLGSIVMDGTDPHYRESHRLLDLSTRHVIEDPIGHDSAVSQWTQIADLVAYAAYWSLFRPSGKEFGWNWYADYLASSDPHGAPRQVTPRHS